MESGKIFFGRFELLMLSVSLLSLVEKHDRACMK